MNFWSVFVIFLAISTKFLPFIHTFDFLALISVVISSSILPNFHPLVKKSIYPLKKILDKGLPYINPYLFTAYFNEF